MASKIDFLKRGLTAEAKSFLDEVIIFTNTEATNAFEKAISDKDIDKYIRKSREEDWVAGPVETLCDDYWSFSIEKNIIKKLKTPTEEAKEVRGIVDLDNVLYSIYNETFTSLMLKKGHDDVKYHNEIFDNEIEPPVEDESEEEK